MDGSQYECLFRLFGCLDIRITRVADRGTDMHSSLSALSAENSVSKWCSSCKQLFGLICVETPALSSTREFARGRRYSCQRYVVQYSEPIKSKNSDRMDEKEGRTRKRKQLPVRDKTQYTLGDLHETRNEPVPNFRRIPFPFFAKHIPHLFVFCYGPCVPNTAGIDPP